MTEERLTAAVRMLHVVTLALEADAELIGRLTEDNPPLRAQAQENIDAIGEIVRKVRMFVTESAVSR